ncbi:MAG: sigma-70 family RNA polymerase sigma factor [Pseudomonadota bacterium]
MSTGHKTEISRAFDADRLDDLARRYGTILRRYFARRNVPGDLCDDLVQDVFTRLAARAGGNDIENAEGYLMQTASSVWNDHWRKTKRRREDENVEFDEFIHSPEGISVQRVIESREAIRMALDALNELPVKTRQIYLMCRLDGAKRKDVAKKLGLTVSSIDKHLMTATKHIGLTLGSSK